MKESTKLLESVNGDIVVQERGDELEEGEGNEGSVGQGARIAEAEDLSLGFVRERRRRGRGESGVHGDPKIRG